MAARQFETQNAWWQRLRAYDKATLFVLLVLPVLALLAGKQDATTLRFALIHAAAIAMIIALTHWEMRLPAWLKFVRDWYPMFLITFFFGELGRAVNVFFPFWLEPYLIQSDYALFGMHAYEFLLPRFSPFRTELFAFAYWAYYPMIPFVAGLFYFTRASKSGACRLTFTQVLNRLCGILYVSYIFIVLCPARGPHHALNVSIEALTSGGFFFNFVLAVQQRGSVVGAAFPSTHAAAAWAMLLALRHDFKGTFWALLPMVVLLSLSTFILQYHYWVDAVAGMLLAFALEGVMTWQENKQRLAAATNSKAQPATRAFLPRKKRALLNEASN